MKYVRRELERQVRKAARGLPATVLTGSRRAGKTWLLRHLFPAADYFLLEDPDVVARLRADPQGFLDAVKTPAILEICFSFTTRRLQEAASRRSPPERKLCHGASSSKGYELQGARDHCRRYDAGVADQGRA
jgi:hypothetical protein